MLILQAMRKSHMKARIGMVRLYEYSITVHKESESIRRANGDGFQDRPSGNYGLLVPPEQVLLEY